MIWAFSLSTLDLCAQSLSVHWFFLQNKKLSLVFGVSMSSVSLWATLTQRVLYPLRYFNERSTYIDFAENQLSPGSFGFSPLVASHPRLLPQTWVRSSKKYHPFFNLLTTRSPGFGFKFWDSTYYGIFGFPTPPPIGLSLPQNLTR